MIVIYLINKISDFLLVKLILCFEKRGYIVVGIKVSNFKLF